MNIPDKAIEAAVRALGCDPLDESFSAGDRAYWQEAAKAAVGASSPFIAAQALRDLADVMHREGGHFEEVDRDNPRAIEWTAAIQSYSKRVRVLAEDMEREQ